MGNFDLTDIPPAPRGVPQIEVTFDINADGIMNISAKDKGTGKSQSIQIKADSGLSESEIEEMIRTAEANAAEDEKFANLANARNEADGRIHAVQKALKEAGDKVTTEETTAVESAISALEAAAKEDDADDIKAKLEALDNAFLPISQKSTLMQVLKVLSHNKNKQNPLMMVSLTLNSPKSKTSNHLLTSQNSPFMMGYFY